MAHLPEVSGVEFKDISDFPGYCVGDDGSVWSRHKWGYRAGLVDAWRPLSLQKHPNGYQTVSLTRGGKKSSKKVH